MSQHSCPDDFDFFPSSPSSHRFTSPPLPECQHVLVSPRRHALPLELIEHIVDLFLWQYRSFRAIRALSEVNSLLRRMVLRRYMTSLNIHSARHLVSLEKMHASMSSRSHLTRGHVGLHWVKSLTAHSGDLARAPWRPSLFENLQALNISFAAEVRSTQKTRSAHIFVPLANSPMTHLTSLTLTALWRIDVLLLNMVSGAFPGLVSLHLSCSEHLDVSCCWSCFEDSASTVVHSPIPNHFPSVSSLTSAFAKALKPLTGLTDLHLGIFLSEEEMLENHIDHYDSPRAYSRAMQATLDQRHRLQLTETVLSQSESPSTAHLEYLSYTEDEKDPNSRAMENTTFDEVPPFPHGPELCPICSIMISGPDVRARELEASLRLAQKLKSLKSISWSSFFAWKLPSESEKKIGDWQRATKMYVLRSGGRVRVRRRPWD